MTLPTLETERLILRDWRPEDLDGLARMAADERWMEHMGPGPGTRSDAWRSMAIFIGHRELRGYTMFVVEEKETGDFVGRVGPWMPEGWPGLEIGWGIDPSRWGRGYAAEAARGAAVWVHDTLGTTHVVHLINPENAKSIRVAEKLGARCTGTFRLPMAGGEEVLIYRTELPIPAA